MGLDFSVRNNVEAMFAQRQATLNNTSLTKALERLSSGYRINRASDDAAGLAVSERLRAQVRGLQQAGRNIQDGLSMIQVAEAGLTELNDILQRMRELSVQSANGIYTNSDRALIQLEVDQLLNEINRSMTSIEFNKQKLLDGTFSSVSGTPLGGGSFVGSMVFHVGANTKQKFSTFISTTSVVSLGLNNLFSSSGAVTGNFTRPTLSVNSLGISRQDKANSALAIIDSAINKLVTRRSKLGAAFNRLEHTYNFVGIAAENMQASESRIRDTDMAEEVINFTKAQVLVQASQAMLAQANLKPTSILQLLS
ncbi:MAG: hypothetical protein A3G34_09655 [Candidatus Lindowbacteria bacterium RIFCSPLOWO2_12_FULL_62_27]|nr:MAG: hypothetical protein A3G34_09655 [Candidatus Lindowbacteria bacterium RIFCSPLOWO2_12_FULL_62_27]OGH61510.1 MAG: hypothetical protein A3I06_02655 [Candidatus Lindowbacteria bacterium RIFCSPLOWO2_02_FULL_62_12]